MDGEYSVMFVLPKYELNSMTKIYDQNSIILHETQTKIQNHENIVLVKIFPRWFWGIFIGKLHSEND